jgi:hypothetical protein
MSILAASVTQQMVLYGQELFKVQGFSCKSLKMFAPVNQ